MNFIKESFPKNKNILFFVLVALIASWGLLFPLPASAGLITSVLLALPGLVLALIGFFTNLFAQLAIILFNFVTSPSFVSLPYTKAGPLPDGNPIIEVGLNITKNFVNLSLVVAMVFIALAITLRLEEYATRKTLVRLIIIALLVNFAPVIVGLVVDASNIIMNYFLSAIQDGVADLFSNIKSSFSTFLSMLKPTGQTPGQQLGQFGKLAISIALDGAISFTFFVLAAIFILRYIAIWILVILSPLAFVAWILPATKKFWDMWWKQLLNWSFIGIPLAFFVYLAIASFAAIKVSFENKITMPGLSPEIAGAAGYFNDLFAFPMILAILWIGIVVGLQSTAMGSSAVINFAKSRGGQIGRGAWKGTKWVAGRIGEKGIRPGLEKARAKEAVGAVARTIEKVPVMRWFMPEKARLYGQMRPTVEKAQARAKSYSSGTLAHRILKGADTQTDALGNLVEILGRGDGQDVFKEAKKLNKWENMSDEEILNDKAFIDRLSRPLKIAQNSGMLSDVLRKDPRLAKVANKAGGLNKIGGFYGVSNQEAVKKAVGEARSQHISNWEPEVFADTDVINSALAKFDRERWLQVNRTIKNGQEKALEGIDKVFTSFIKEKGLESQNATDVWNNQFKQHIIETQGGEGYFKALEDNRVKQTGWRGGQLAKETTVEKIQKEVEGIRKLNKPLSPWQAAVEKQEKKRLETIGQVMKKKKEEKKKK